MASDGLPAEVMDLNVTNVKGRAAGSMVAGVSDGLFSRDSFARIVRIPKLVWVIGFSFSIR